MFYKKAILKTPQYSQEAPVLESAFNKVAALQVCNFIKKRLQHLCFLVNIAYFLRTPVLKIYISIDIYFYTFFIS